MGWSVVRYGGVSRSLTATKKNTMSASAYTLDWRKKNPKKWALAMRRYRAKHRDAVRKSRRRWYRKNRIRLRKRALAYYRRHPEKRREYNQRRKRKLRALGLNTKGNPIRTVHCLTCGKRISSPGPLQKYCGSTQAKRGCSYKNRVETNRAYMRRWYRRARQQLPHM